MCRRKLLGSVLRGEITVIDTPHSVKLLKRGPLAFALMGELLTIKCDTPFVQNETSSLCLVGFNGASPDVGVGVRT